MPRTVFVGLILVLHACAVDLTPPASGATITCETSAQCPDGRVCVTGFCRAAVGACVDVVGGVAAAVQNGNLCNFDNGFDGICLDAQCRTSVCGDGYTDELLLQEECDDADLNSDDLRGACRENCQLFGCGDGVIDPFEQCDNGAANSDDTADACRTDCTPARCGDGEVDTGEVCDDGNQTSGDGCRNDCLSNESCGNEIIDLAASEQCDEGLSNSDAADASCRTNCQPRRCGDGIIDTATGEQCEPGVAVTETCLDRNFHVDGPVGCTAACNFDTTSCSQRCGDGTRNGPEQCDGDDLGDDTCLTRGFWEGTLGCNAACGFELSGCDRTCGDGFLDEEEICDTEPTPMKSCVEYGFDLGHLACRDYCAPDFDGCSTFGWDKVDVEPVPIRWYQSIGGSGADDVFLVGDGATIAHWDGTDWAMQANPAGNLDIWGIWADAPNNAYAVGASKPATAPLDPGIILHNQGGTWQEITLAGATPGLLDVYGVDGVVVAVGVNCTILVDTGAGFSQLASDCDSNPAARLWGVWGASSSEIVVVGGYKVIISIDASTSTPTITGIERPADVAAQPALRSVWGSAADNLFAVGRSVKTLADEPAILHRDSSGSWVAEPVPFADLWDVFGTSADNIFAVGAVGGVVHYTGPELGWRQFPLRDNAWRTGIWGSSADNILAVGSAGAVHHFTGAAWLETDDYGLTGSENIRAVWSTHDDGRVFAVATGTSTGNNGSILRFDGNSTTAITTVNDQAVFKDLWSTASTDIYLVGSASNGTDVITRYNDDTELSVTMTTPGRTDPNPADSTGLGLLRVWGFASDNVYAVGTYGTVLHYDGDYGGDGLTWTRVTLPGTVPEVELWGVWGSAPDDIYVVGESSTVIHYDGSWNHLTPPGSRLRHVWGSAANDIYMVGVFGRILHYDGAGTWEVQSSNTEAWLNTIWGNAADDIFATGGDGTLLHFDGTAWQTINVEFNRNPLNGVWSNGAHTFVVGGNGTFSDLLRTTAW